MYKSKRQKNKSFDWYGLSQRFSIRKYHFGAASVLLGTALILGAAQSTANAEEATADNKTEAVTSTPKDGEGATSPTNVTLPATEATTGAPVLDKKELSEEEIAKLVAEASKKDDKTSETATTEKSEVTDKEKATQAADSTDKKSEKAVDDKADKKDEKKAENPIAATKTILEQLTSEAEVLNTTAANYAEKKVEDKSSKEAIAAAVAAAKVEIAASKKVLNQKDVTAEQLNLQLQRISSAIEAVYTEMKRAGHIGKVEAVLDEANTANAGGRDSAPRELTPVLNAEDLTDSEVAAIIKQIRTSNPGLTNEDVITVNKTRGSQAAGFTTITYADGSGSVTFEPGQVMVASAGIKNLEQLSSSINWFNFASATITYTDGTVATPVRYFKNTTATPDGRLYKQLDANTGTTGRTLEGYFSMYREVTLGRDYTVDGVLYAKGAKLKSTDDTFLKMGIAKYEQHIYYSGGKQGETNVKVPNASNPTTYTTKKLGEIYEVLQVGMKFDVPTRVEGYRLSATVSKLAPKEVATDPQKGQGNRLRYYTNGVNGKNTTDTTAVYDIVDAQGGGGRGVDVLLTTQDKTNSYLRKAGIETTYRERIEGYSETNPTGTKREGLTAFSSSRDHSNFGVSLYLQATYNGQLVPVNAVVADADESGLREYSQFETDGGAWEKLMEVHWDNRRLDNNGDAIVDGNGTSILVDKNGKAYVDNAGNPMFINKYWKTTREDVVTNGINEAKYYLTTASRAKVLVSEKDNLPILDAEGNPTILDSTGTRMTTTKDGMFQNGYIGKDDSNQNVFKIGSTNGIKVRQVLDAEGRPILRGGSIPGLAAFILPSGVKTTSLETVNGKKKLFDTTDGKHKEITRDFYGNSILWTDGSVDGRVSATDTLKFTNPNKKPIKLTTASDIGDFKDAGYEPSEWVSPSAYGNKTFGSFSTAVGDGYRLPIGLTEGVSNLSFYGNSTSSVSGFIGFVVTDGGDAPKSYGSAKHIIGNFNKVENNQEVTATQPYLGDQPGDPDFRSTVNEKSGDWVLDDLVMTNKYVEKDLGAGETDPTQQVKVTNQKGDTGTFLITANGNAVIRKEDGIQVAVNQGDVLTTPDPATGLPMIGIYNATTKKLGVGAIPDEGEAQLLDPDAVDNTGKKIKGEYTLRQASDTEYVLYGVKANPGVNNKEAYLRGWVDFNGNGKFDVDEASELIKVTPGQKTYDVKFKNVAQLLDTAIDKAGVRLRIALEEQDIRESTGLAGSGEVEDFQTFVTHFPRGTRHETKDYQGQEQGIKFPTNSMFIANGKSKDSGYKNWAQINNVELSPKIVLTDKVVDTTKVTTLDPNAEKDKTDLGTKGIVSRLRKKSDGSIYMQDGKVFVDKNDSTVLTGRLVEVKDKNNKVLGTALEVVNPNNKKTEYLMSEYTEYDSVGNKVGTYKVNPATAGDNKEITGGFYETAVTFKPELGFVGKAKGIAIRAWDDNNNSTGWEANNDTIEASKASTTLAEKDKVLENTNNGNNGYKTMDTSYIPTVIDVRPIGEDTTTTDVQGKKQSARPQIPVYGTVETETGDKITDSRYANEFEIIDKNKSIKLADTLESNKSSYDKDTEVSKATTLTLADGKVVTYTPDKDKLPARAKIAEDADVVVTGTGSVVVNNVRLVTGKTIPAGSSPVDPHPVTADTVVTLANGTETTIPAGERIPTGAKLKNSLVSTANNTWNNVTYNTGDTIPRESGGKISTLAKETSISQIVGKGDVVKVDGKYRATNTIPAGTKVKRILPLNQVVLPSATHLDPTTGAITEVPRSYDLANTNDSKVTITGEGVYELVKDASGKPTGEVTFTPEPGFVGRGTGVDLVQPDIDYNDVVANDKVTEKYGTDYGRAKYTPIVTPVTEASITRTIHYVYESDNDATATSQASYKNNNPILSINNEPVTRSQTLNYTRTYKMFDEDGVLDQPMVTANTVRDVNGTEYTAGTEIPKGTKFSQGTLIIYDWKHGENNEEMNSIVSPTVKGYTANVVTLEYNAPNATGEMAHIKDAKEIGTYKPIDRNTKDVGTYKPASSAIRSDDKDNFDMYVVYKADTQKAKVTYIDLDATGDARILEVQTAATAPTTGADAKTTYGVTTLQGKSHTKIPYLTADTIKKYKDLGYELVTDDYTNNTQGTAIEGGRKFDDDKDVDQAFNVYLRHKKVLRQIKDTQEVTRTIEYKYASTDDVPADKRGTTAAPTVTETLHFERDRTIDYTLAAKEYPTEYATYKAVLDKSGYDSPEEYKVRTVYYDHITNKAIAADATAAQKAIVTFGPWTPVGGTATGVTLTPAEVAKDDKFNLVNSPEVTGYTPDNATVEATAAIDAEADDYKITVLYTPVAQKAVVKFVEVDPTNTDKVITPGLADPIAVTGKSEAAYPATTATSVTDKIAELVKKGYELVNNGFVSTDKFDKDAAVDQEYVVKFKAKVVDIPSFDPTKPKSDDNPRPIPGKTPIDPNNPDGPKWTPELIKELEDGRKEEVKRTINYVYADGKKAADSVQETKEFKRSATINPITGKITFGEWSPANQTFGEVTSPEIKNYTPNKATVPASEVTATAEDINETVVYTTKPITLDPSKPTDPNTPNVTPKPDDRVPNDPKGRTYKELGLIEEVTHTVHYKLEDGSDAGIADNVQTLTFTRTAEVDPVTGAISNYGTWKARGGDTTIDAVTTPNKDGYVASAKTSTERTNVSATDKDSEETIIYRKLGSYVPVVPEGITPPADADLNPKPYPNATPADPTKPGTPTETPVVPYIPGTTPVGPNGKPLTPKDPNNPTKGYEVPGLPTDPTENTTITYVKDGSQVAVVHFIEVNSETDKTEKGAVAESVVDTGDTGKAFTKAADVTSTIEALKAKGYTVVENNYPTDGTFDADSKTNQVYKVLVTAKPITVNPNDPTPTKDQPIDPNNPTGPKWTPELIKELEDGRKEEVKRTIKYVYADGSKAADSVQETKEFKRSATINPVTGKVTFGEWSPAQTFESVTSPKVTNFTPDKESVPAAEVTATAEDINETVIYTTKPANIDPSKPTDPNTPNVTPKPDDKVPNDPKGRTYKELGLIEEVTHTVHYKLADGSDAGIPDNVQTLTFTRTADLDPVTGAISNFGTWKAKDDDTTIDAVPTPAKEGYVASAAKSTARESVKATDKDSEETIIYRKLGSYVPVIPEGVTPPANTDLTPKPYPNNPNDPTKPETPTETPVVPYIPGTTPVGPNGKPLTPKDPNDPTKGYEVPKVPEDPTQNTTITYVKDGSQVALVHFIKADGTAVHVSVAEAGDTGKAIKTTNIDNVKAELEAKGYEVVAPTDPAYTTERVAFYADANRTFDDKDDKGDSGISQVYYVIVKEGISPIDPDKPLDPNNPNVTPKPGDKVPGDPKQRTYEQLGLLDEVNRTINYRYANTDKVEEAKRGKEAAATVEQKLRYSRKGDLNKVTGEITYTSDWTEPQTLAEVTSPVIEGYVADIKAAEKVENVAHDAADSVVNVVYTPLGKYVPKVPEGFEVPKVEKPQYPNDPTDPTKPGTPTTVIPHVPGTTPKDPNGNPLKPVDPNDPTKGYVPPTPENPTEDTQITYEKDTQKAKVTYVVEGTGTVLHTDNLEGKSGEPIEYSTVAKLAELKALGYDLVTDGFTTATDKNYDKDTKVDQSFVVTVTPHVEPIKPVDPENPNDSNKPKPGDPIDPKNPDGPKWTEDLIKKIDTTRHVNRTIKYINENGEEVAKKVTDKVTFNREAKINSVTGEITYGNWTAKDGDTTFDKVESPVVKGYILKDAKQKEVAATTGLTADSKDENIEVVYTKLGSWVPKVPEGETPIDPLPYPNDPNDPTKPGNDRPIVPYVPGTTPKGPNGNPLKPVDPNDPSKGYVPPTPETPTEDTEITYEKDTQKAKVTYVVEGTGTVLHTDNLEGKSGEPIDYSTVAKLAELKALGYDLVSDGFTTATDKNYDKDTKVDQSFVVTVAPHVEPIKPVDPTNPNDPNTPKPGQPIDPNNPDGPKWTEELINKLETTKHVTRKITYVEDGTDKEVADKATDKVTFTREAKINVVTGTIEYGKWTPVNNDTTFDKVTSPVVPGYVLKDPAQKEVAETTGLTENSKDETIKVVYVPVGRLVPKVPEGVTPPTPTPYDNDPQDPGKVVPPSPTKPTDPQDPNSPKVPVIPHIPGTTPKVPQDPTKPVDPNTNPLVPLKPVDPKDPSKGYEVPPVPTDPGTDTPIVYENDKQKAITNFVDNNGKVVSDPVVDQGDSGSKFTKSGDVESKIKELVKKGYVVTSNDYPSADTDRVFDNDKDKDQIFNVKVTPLIVPTDPNSPDQPQVPTDPTKPVGPNNPLKPVTPSTPEPGKPVFPEDPNSPVWPETVKDMVTETTATRTITYVDRNGKEVAATHTETIKFKRTAKVNLVTGDITYGEWIVVGNDTILDGNKLPKVDGYIARGGDIKSSQKDIKATAGVNITERVVYDKLGSWIPKLPEGQTQVPPTPYPNDPTDPTKPGTDRPRVPYVPGFIPVDPNGNPLKPVDPNDPTKGYEVPVVPADPTQDTPIKYIPVPKPNNGGGNNGGGGGNTPTPQPQPNPTPQPEPSPAPNPVPVTPETPEQPVVPVAPEQPAEPATPQYMDGQRELPNTGTEAHSSLAALGLLGALSGFGLIARKKRKDEE